MWSFKKKLDLPSAEEALPGRASRLPVPSRHAVLDAPIDGPFPDGLEVAYVGMGCFWGAERIFWRLPGVFSTSVGYQGGITPNPTYEETCSGMTGHTEAVRVVFDPSVVAYGEILRAFWEGHDPTQGMGQGNDIGTQYRSTIFYNSPAQQETAERVKARVAASGTWKKPITTSIEAESTWWRGEEYHQDYLQKNPGGYSCHWMRD